MRWTLGLLVVSLAACGGNQASNQSKDTVEKDVAGDVGDPDLGSDGDGDGVGDLGTVDRVGDGLDLGGMDLIEDLADASLDTGDDNVDVEDTTEVWWDWFEDTKLPDGCGNHIIEDQEVCDGGSKPCTSMLMNFISGNAYCKEDCTGWSTAGCITNGTPYCGNGIKEGLEGCDGTPKPCSALGAGWTEGTAVCSFDCKTYDIAECKTNLPAYGYLDVNFATPYIMNDNFITDSTYLAAHPDAFIAQPTFVGQFGVAEKSIPNSLAQSTVSYALRDTQKNWLYVLQESVSMATYQNPQIEMHFAYPDLVPGDYPLNFQVMGATRLYLFNYLADGTKCLLAVGIGGAITVTSALNSGEDEGGQLAFEAQQIPIYYITESPYGQALADGFGAMPLCAKE